MGVARSDPASSSSFLAWERWFLGLINSPPQRINDRFSGGVTSANDKCARQAKVGLPVSLKGYSAASQKRNASTSATDELGMLTKLPRAKEVLGLPAGSAGARNVLCGAEHGHENLKSHAHVDAIKELRILLSDEMLKREIQQALEETSAFAQVARF